MPYLTRVKLPWGRPKWVDDMSRHGPCLPGSFSPGRCWHRSRLDLSSPCELPSISQPRQWHRWTWNLKGHSHFFTGLFERKCSLFQFFTEKFRRRISWHWQILYAFCHWNYLTKYRRISRLFPRSNGPLSCPDQDRRILWLCPELFGGPWGWPDPHWTRMLGAQPHHIWVEKGR